MAKGFVVAAPSSGSGKTVLTLGLLRALHDRGLAVSSAKAGPDYIDPRFHEAATGHPCFNLDLWSMGGDGVRGLAAHAARHSELLIVEGVMGLFDGPEAGAGSTADLAKALSLPVVLVVDVARQSQSAAALVHGFATFPDAPCLAGVILNNAASERHADMVRDALAKAFRPVPILGAVLRHSGMQLPSRHLGLIQAQENQELEQFISQAASIVARETNLDELLTVGTQVLEESRFRPKLPPLAQRIAVASDKAFAFAYPHLLEAWCNAGAEIRLFSPLADEAPDQTADAVFLPGGYPELHAGRLSGNRRFMAALRASNALIYGECGGYMVLGDALIDQNGVRHPMAGLLPLETSFVGRKPHLGYRQLEPLAGPWRRPIRGHEFHYSSVTRAGEAAPLFEARDAAGRNRGLAGMRRDKVMGSYMHVIAEAP